MSSGWILLGVIAVIALFVFGAYNRLWRWRSGSRRPSPDIDVQLKQRHDLIPNLARDRQRLRHPREGDAGRRGEGT